MGYDLKSNSQSQSVKQKQKLDTGFAGMTAGCSITACFWFYFFDFIFAVRPISRLPNSVRQFWVKWPWMAISVLISRDAHQNGPELTYTVREPRRGKRRGPSVFW
jgi:hypothetical protein